jgi:DNA invertase Pin-like site-specific DNA recombinase
MKVKVHVLNVGLLEDTAMGNFFITTLLAVAELERNMIVERTQAGKAIARTKDGFREGRPPLPEGQLQHAMNLLQEHSYNQVVTMTGISKSTLIRARRRKI